MAFNACDELTPDQLRILLDDTQASLAASFARIEAYRIQNRQLLDEVSQLRSHVHGGREPQAAGSHSEPGVHRVPSEACSINFPQQKNAAPVWTSLNSRPVLISDLEGEHPVQIINGGKKVRLSILQSQRQEDAAQWQTFELLNFALPPGANQPLDNERVCGLCGEPSKDPCA